MLRPPRGPDRSPTMPGRRAGPDGGPSERSDRLGELGRAFTAALVRGEDPGFPGSRLHAGDGGAGSPPGPVAELAGSLRSRRGPERACRRTAGRPGRVRVWPTSQSCSSTSTGPSTCPTASTRSPRSTTRASCLEMHRRRQRLDRRLAGAAGRAYPWVRVLAAGQQPRLRAGGERRRRGPPTADCIVLVNNDMRVEPDWSSASSSRAYDPAAGAVCVGRPASVDWDGEHLDFGEGSLQLLRHGPRSATTARSRPRRIDDGRRAALRLRRRDARVSAAVLPGARRVRRRLLRLLRGRRLRLAALGAGLPRRAGGRGRAATTACTGRRRGSRTAPAHPALRAQRAAPIIKNHEDDNLDRGCWGPPCCCCQTGARPRRSDRAPLRHRW